MENNFYLAGGDIISPEGQGFVDLHIHDGCLQFLPRIKNSTGLEQGLILDVSGCYITPGLIDLQVNGTAACNLWANPTKQEFQALCLELLHAGVTAFLPTLITDDMAHMKKNIYFLESMGAGGAGSVSNQNDCQKSTVISLGSKLRKRQISQSGFDGLSPERMISMPGIHLEGPFISKERAGVHPIEFIKNPTSSNLADLIKPAVKLVTLAPEIDGADSATKFLIDRGITVSLGHSNASFDKANQAFASGIRLFTHIFNASRPLHHRNSGAVEAALLDNDVSCCIIADGLHVGQAMVKLLMRLKGSDRVVLVTDVASIGTTSGGLVGSSVMLSDAVRNMVLWRAATFPEAIKMATFNPAKAINMEHELGIITDGGPAHLVVWDKNSLAIKHVVANGYLVF